MLVGVNSGIENIEGLAGKSVAAVEGTTGIEQIRQYASKTPGQSDGGALPGYNEALSAMRAGDIDALTTDRAFLLQTAQDNPEFTVVGERFTPEPYGIGVRSGDAHFRMLVNFTLQQFHATARMKKSTTDGFRRNRVSARNDPLAAAHRSHSKRHRAPSIRPPAREWSISYRTGVWSLA